MGKQKHKHKNIISVAILAVELFPHPKQLIWKTETESREMQRLIGKSETERNKNRLGKQKQKHKQEDPSWAEKDNDIRLKLRRLYKNPPDHGRNII